MMSTPPPLLFSCCPFFSLVKRPGKKSTHNYDTTTTTTKKPIQLRSSNRLIYEFFFFEEKVLLQGQNHSPPLSTLSRSIYKATSTYNIPPNIISDSFLFVCERLTIYKVVRTQNLLYTYISTVMDKSVICFILLLLLPMLYIIIIFLFFLPKSYCFFVAIKQHPHLLQTYND